MDLFERYPELGSGIAAVVRSRGISANRPVVEVEDLPKTPAARSALLRKLEKQQPFIICNAPAPRQWLIENGYWHHGFVGVNLLWMP